MDMLHHTPSFNSYIFVHNMTFFLQHLIYFLLTRCPVKIIKVLLKLKNVGCALLCTVFSGRAH